METGENGIHPMRKWLWEKQAERCVRNLCRNGFDALWVADGAEALHAVMERVGHLERFGLGGSETLRQIGLPAALAGSGKTIYDHWRQGLSADEEHDLRLMQGRADCFICSANAIAASGEIVNVDGIGNRTAAMTFGPPQVVIVAGMNKVTPDLPGALQRVREVAAPMRARSLGMETPCARSGRCSDCDVPQRICRVTTSGHRRPLRTAMLVVLVAQALGY